MIIKPLLLRAAPLLTRMKLSSSPNNMASSTTTTKMTTTTTTTPEEILQFWFQDLSFQQWFTKSDTVDNTIHTKFSKLHTQATMGELDSWRTTAEGSLAEIIVLDQFSRNLFRNSPKAFAHDGMALVLAQVAISKGYDKELTQQQCNFLYMPFMHSESLAVHDRAVELFTDLGHEMSLEYEMKHRVIIERFGRYPHRNTVLGRTSSEEEIEFLKGPDSSF